jgi:predicted small metal-binding protein
MNDMKKIICSDLGGPEECEVEIKGNTPEEVVKNCQEHVMEEVENGDSAHQDAVEDMQGMSPEEQQEKYTEYMQICSDAFKRA